jgi:hypothetical protein
LEVLVFSVITAEGIPLDNAFSLLYTPQNITVKVRNQLGFISTACGISVAVVTLEDFRGTTAHVRLAKKALPDGGFCWTISNWGIPAPDGSYKWLYQPDREEAELNRSLAGKRPERPEMPKNPPAVSSPRPEAAPPLNPDRDFIGSNVDEVLGEPDNKTADSSSKPKHKQAKVELFL